MLSEDTPPVWETSFDSARGGFEEFTQMPAQKEIRYHRHSKFRGQAVRLVESVPGMAGVWTCVTPALMVTTIQLGARSAVSTAPKSGVTYAAAPLSMLIALSARISGCRLVAAAAQAFGSIT